VRVLVTLTPLMYREAIAYSLARSRPAFEVRITSPQRTEEEVRAFGPQLLIRNDTDGLEPGVLAGVPCWVEVMYSDSMDVRVCLGGRVEEAEDMSTEGLLRVADEAADLVERPS
jgi:hypothetical protein